jgi:chitinase
MMPMHAGSVPLYGEFTVLKRNGLQTWIAVGSVNVNLLSVYSGLSTILGPRLTMRTATWSQYKPIAAPSFGLSSSSWIRTASRARISIGVPR